MGATTMHGSAAGIIFFRNGSLRCALFPEKKIPPATLAEIARLPDIAGRVGESRGSRARARSYRRALVLRYVIIRTMPKNNGKLGVAKIIPDRYYVE
jgi:hypothetical protein